MSDDTQRRLRQLAALERWRTLESDIARDAYASAERLAAQDRAALAAEQSELARAQAQARAQLHGDTRLSVDELQRTQLYLRQQQSTVETRANTLRASEHSADRAREQLAGKQQDRRVVERAHGRVRQELRRERARADEHELDDRGAATRGATRADVPAMDSTKRRTS
jgi:flagellar biosynthesis chaperone FliJ